ncbi:MAG TPA: glycine cleavage T C-terminal barrel domain-containing protein [Aquihabitans sp.]|jgi:folate-binding protein YgfZ|nr:glycine cleavage T C-terminal barrel domain-containing protein [Aquihabitans sp.]
MTAVVARTARDLLTVRGPEAATWLQGQLSQDVAGLAPGASAWTFVLAPQGKVDGWGRIHRVDDDTFEIDVDPGAGAAWSARLLRFKLRTKAEVELATDVPTVAVRGGGTDGPLAEAAAGGLPAGWPGTDGVDVLRAGDEVVEALVAAGASEADRDALEALRIRSGAPRWGAELDGDTIPATVGQWAIDASVSFTKGCYTGQELVARIDSRGGNVPRRLTGLVLDGPPPAAGTEVTVDGAVAGTVTSSAPDPATGGSVALAYVGRGVEVPAAAEVGGRPAGLAPLPLPPPG